MEKREDNFIRLSGFAVAECTFSHKIENGKVYEVMLAVKRKKGDSFDYIPVRFCEKIAVPDDIDKGQFYYVEGTVRDRKCEKGKPEVYVWADSVQLEEDDSYVNAVELKGIVDREIVKRMTPKSNIEIADIKLKISSENTRTYILPCVAWYANARFAANNYSVGDTLKIIGHICSRTYRKRIDVDKVYEKDIREISVISVKKL